jgi:LuxR family maltose regulon positive regulatory protein
LVKQLNEGFDRKLTLISAPAGYGKTTLLSEWIQSGDNLFCWVTLDESDNDQKRFLSYLFASLKTINIEIDAQTINRLQSYQESILDDLLIAIINQLSDIPFPFAVVLDDYHHISSENVHHVVEFLLEHLPPHAHLVIATRADPPLPIGLFRARNQLTELRSSDLQFSPEESDTLFNQINSLDITTQNIEAIVSRTGGWVTGLQMASLALKGRSDPNQYIQTFSGSHDYIVDFLTTQVLQEQPKNIQEFLLSTSILARFSATLCEAVSGQKNGHAILKNLKDDNLFLISLDDHNEWYAYYQLFRDLLFQRLVETNPSMIPTLYQNASEWFEAHGYFMEAITYAIRGEHFEKALALIAMHAEETISQGGVTILIQWVKKIPEELVKSNFQVCLYYSWALLIHRDAPNKIEKQIENLEKFYSTYPGEILAVKAYQATLQGKITNSTEYARQALELLPENALFVRQLTALNLSASLFLAGEILEGEKMLEEVVKLSLKSGNSMIAVVTLCRIGSIRMQKGDLSTAGDSYQRALEAARDENGSLLPSACEAYFGLGKIKWERFELDSANQYLIDGIELSKQWSEVSAIESYIVLAQLKQTLGETAEANQLLQTAQKITNKNSFTQSGSLYVASQNAYLRLRQKEYHFSENWANERGLSKYLESEKLEASSNFGVDFIRNIELIVYARILVAKLQYNEAFNLIEKLTPILETFGQKNKLIEAMILKALINYKQGNEDLARTEIKEALRLASPGKFIRVFIDEGPEIIHLIQQVEQQGYTSQLIEQILAGAGLQKKTPAHSENLAVLIEPLSDREIDVLRRLDSDLPVPEIADQLVVTVSTLRTHIRNIYQKLGVHSRFEAVSKAKDLKII